MVVILAEFYNTLRRVALLGKEEAAAAAAATAAETETERQRQQNKYLAKGTAEATKDFGARTLGSGS